MGATPQQRSSLKPVLALAFAGGALALIALLSSGNDPRIEYLQQLQEEHARQTAGFRPDRSNFPLPRIDKGLAELRYLEKLADRMERSAGDCMGTEEDLLKIFSVFDAERGDSLYLPAARSLARREGQDFVGRSSDSIRGGPGFGLRARLRPQQAVDPDRAVEQLREKKAMIDLVEGSRAGLAGAVTAAEEFVSRCPDRAEVLDRVLGYFLLHSKGR